FAAERCAVESKRCLRNQDPLGIILLDIDHFKQVNDSWGHAAGDRVLQDIARILQSGARPYDLPVRLGGEEFMLLCDNAGPDVVQMVAERIRQAVEAHEFVLDDGRSIRITSSLGCCSQVADADADAALMQTMIDRADKALYCAKRGGRNRVELAPA
ncbi:MAG: GGDEF domain-containing protein, partial [Thiopseudomonas sp.]